MYRNQSLSKRDAMKRILRGNIGVYKFKYGEKPWRFVIQHHGKHIAKYYPTKKEALNNWLFTYCRIHGIDYIRILRKLPKTKFFNILRK